MSSEKKSGFLSGIKKEFGKITWPKKGELMHTSLVVMASIVAVSVVVYLLDTLFHFLLSFTV